MTCQGLNLKGWGFCLNTTLLAQAKLCGWRGFDQECVAQPSNPIGLEGYNSHLRASVKQKGVDLWMQSEHIWCLWTIVMIFLSLLSCYFCPLSRCWFVFCCLLPLLWCHIIFKFLEMWHHPPNPHSQDLSHEAVQAVLQRWCEIFLKAIDGATTFSEKVMWNRPPIPSNNYIFTGHGWID